MIPLPLLLGALTINEETAFAYPLVLAVLGLGVWGARQQARLEHSDKYTAALERTVEKLAQRVDGLEGKHGDMNIRLTNSELVLGRVDAMVSDIHKVLFKPQHRESA